MVIARSRSVVALDATALAAFDAFASTLNFTHAARALRVTQPAVFAQVARLAEAVGAPLYRRNGRRLELTRAGVQVAAHARETRERTVALLADLAGERAPEPVVLCAGEGTYLYFLGPAIARFRSSHDVPLELLTRDRAGTIEAVRSGEAHLGVAPVDGIDCSGLESEPVVRVGQAVVTPADHPLARRKTLSLGDLAGERLIVAPQGRPHRAMLEAAMRAAEIPWRVAVEANGWPLAMHFVALGLGLAVVNDFCRAPPGLAARPLSGVPRSTYALLRRRGAPSTGPRDSLARALRELAHDRARS